MGGALTEDSLHTNCINNNEYNVSLKNTKTTFLNDSGLILTHFFSSSTTSHDYLA